MLSRDQPNKNATGEVIREPDGKLCPGSKLALGNPGNPVGKISHGSRFIRAWLTLGIDNGDKDGEVRAAKLLRAMYDAALGGDTTAGKILLEYAYGKPREQPTEIEERVSALIAGLAEKQIERAADKIKRIKVYGADNARLGSQRDQDR